MLTIPDNILNCCEVIHINRPPKSIYNKFLKNKLSKKIKLEDITNIKNLYDSNERTHMHLNYKIICDKIINNMINIDETNFLILCFL